MYVHPILSEYFRRHNKEYSDGKPQSLNKYDLEELKKDRLQGLLEVNKFTSDIEYFTNFRLFCEGETRDIQQKFTSKKFYNFIDIVSKTHTIFELQLQQIKHGNYHPEENICTSSSSFYRESIFKKHIIINPESYFQYLGQTIKHLFKWRFNY